MDNYVAVATPGAAQEDRNQRGGGAHGADASTAGATATAGGDPASQQEGHGHSVASFFGLRDNSESVSGEPVDDPELEAAAHGVDVSTKFMCVSKETAEKYLPIVVSISMGAYFGVGIRMLLTEFTNALSDERGALLRMLGGSFFLPNVLGCFVMGFIVRYKVLLRDRFSVYITGITTGFCGSCTTFSSFDVAAAGSFVHGNVVTWLLMIGVNVASSFVSHRSGIHVAEALIKYLSQQSAAFAKPAVDADHLSSSLEKQVQDFDAIRANDFADGVRSRVASTRDALAGARDAANALSTEIAHASLAQPPHVHKFRVWMVVAIVLFLWLWIPLVLGLGNYPSSRLFGLALGPFGALLRFYLAQFNSKPACKDFPKFTLLANFAASVLSCLLIVIGSSIVNRGGAGFRAYVFLGDGGLIVGFCGSLSTVATWIYEIDGIAARNMFAAYKYALGTILVSQAASILILGIYVLAASSSAPLLV